MEWLEGLENIEVLEELEILEALERLEELEKLEVLEKLENPRKARTSKKTAALSCLRHNKKCPSSEPGHFIIYKSTTLLFNESLLAIHDDNTTE